MGIVNGVCRTPEGKPFVCVRRGNKVYIVDPTTGEILSERTIKGK